MGNDDGTDYDGTNYDGDDDATSLESFSDIQAASKVTGMLGIDPFHFTMMCSLLLIMWIFYLLLPKGVRAEFCAAYPKRYAWSERTKRRRRRRIELNLESPYSDRPPSDIGLNLPPHNGLPGIGVQISTDSQSLNDMNRKNAITPSTVNNRSTSRIGDETIDFTSSSGRQPPHTTRSNTQTQTTTNNHNPNINNININNNINSTNNDNHNLNNRNQQIPPRPSYDFSTPQVQPRSMDARSIIFSTTASMVNDEIIISATMQRLREEGILVIAHGSRGKPKNVRLQLDENAITWYTEGRKNKRKPNKPPKEHRVPLSHIMYVDVGKQTTALRRVENASVPDTNCLSLLTKEGSLDLEASNASERDALVGCFSMVLDEVHARNWRDVYRAPSSDMPSSFDEYDGTEHDDGAMGSHLEV